MNIERPNGMSELDSSVPSEDYHPPGSAAGLKRYREAEKYIAGGRGIPGRSRERQEGVVYNSTCCHLLTDDSNDCEARRETACTHTRAPRECLVCDLCLPCI